jgi:hypothetical protein
MGRSVGYKSDADDKMNRAGKEAWVCLCLAMDPVEQTSVRLAKETGDGAGRVAEELGAFGVDIRASKRKEAEPG